MRLKEGMEYCQLGVPSRGEEGTRFPKEKREW